MRSLESKREKLIIIKNEKYQKYRKNIEQMKMIMRKKNG